MKVMSLFAASVFAAGLALSPAAFAAGDTGYQQSSGMSSQGQSSRSMASASDPQQVKEIQQALKDQGYRVGPIDGKMGPQTSNALRSFQRDQGMQTSGEVDQQTLQALGVTGTGETQEQFGVSPEFGDQQQEQQQPSDQLEDQSGSMGGSSSESESGTSGSGMDSGSGASGSESGGSGGMSR